MESRAERNSSRTGSFGLGARVAVAVQCIFVTRHRELTRWDRRLLLIGFVGFNLHLYGLI